jgi:SpoVK/Ycf46/Vps4 family AAA+-type ATPase
MLDELDTISSIRDAASDGPDREMARVTVTIMQLLDTLPPHVTLLAATNRPDAVDPALSRRFAKRFPIGRPPTGDHVCRIVSDFLADCDLTCETTMLETARTALEDARANDAEMPTQSDVVSALIDAIVVHEVADLSSLDPVDVSFLLDMVPSDPME